MSVLASASFGQDKLTPLIENRPDDRALTLRSLWRNGVRHRTDMVRDGADALDFRFARGSDRAGQPFASFALLDFKLLRISGLEVFPRVRDDQSTRHLPVVILTSSREDEDLILGYGLMANSHVRRPVDFVQLMDAARQVCTHRLCLYEEPINQVS